MARGQGRARCSSQCQSHRRCEGVVGPVRCKSRLLRYRRRCEHTNRRRESNDCVRIECEGLRMSSDRRISSLPLYTINLHMLSARGKDLYMLVMCRYASNASICSIREWVYHGRWQMSTDSTAFAVESGRYGAIRPRHGAKLPIEVQTYCKAGLRKRREHERRR